MRRLSWKVGLAGAALIVTTVYAVAQMMMGMMKQMSQMMDRCSNMMQGGPHDRRDAPATPEKKD